MNIRSGIAAGVALCAALVMGCSESTSSDGADRIAPTIKLQAGASTVDSVLAFAADVRDNLGIKRVHVDAIGGITASYDTVFSTAVTNTNLSLYVGVPRSVPSGTPITFLATAFDGAGNKSQVDTLKMTAGNLAPASVKLTAPVSGSAAVIGKSIILSISGVSKVRVAGLGFTTTGAYATKDSTMFSSPLKDSTALLDTLAIPSSATTGSLVITPFLRDSLGNRFDGLPVTVNVQTASNVVAPPIVNFGSEKRIEVTDTLFVNAIDTTGAGIARLGYEIRTQANGPIVVRDSVASNSQFTSQQYTFHLNLPPSLFSTFPQVIYLKSFATTGTNARGYAKLANGVERVDTLVVVAGVTRILPNGGSVADAFYHPRWDRLYLTNIERDQLEVFSLADSTFHSPIPVGSRPWGITVWPRDRTGTLNAMGDTLLIANSGGTSIGYVDIADRTLPFSQEGREVYTYPLPNLIAYTVTTVASTTGGPPLQQRTRYDFSDRPQYVAATCKTPSLASNTCSEVVLVYSTTPTPGQTVPFPNRGTIRWENLTTQESHFFFEQAMGQSAGRADTLEIERFGAGCRSTISGRVCVGAEDSILVPALQTYYTPHTPAYVGDTKTIDTTLFATVVEIDKLAFYDTTFVRSSGNFLRAIMGEGGFAKDSRVIGYDAMRGMQTTFRAQNGNTYPLAVPVVDNGVSKPVDVTDFRANANAKVRGVGINFDGELSAVRADSIYLIDSQLRQLGLFQTPNSGNAGFDFHPRNAGNGITSTRQSCFLFAASTEPVIEVYENHYYQRVATLPVKAPIIGPIKSALRSNGEIVLIGATTKGVVIVTVPSSLQVNGCPL